jgi:hypothetical protein
MSLVPRMYWSVQIHVNEPVCTFDSQLFLITDL